MKLRDDQDATIRLGATLRQLRREYGITQDDLAGMLHVDRTTIANWERGIRQPGLDSLVRLRGVFGASLDRLVFGPAQAASEETRRPRPKLLRNPWLRGLAEQTDVPVPFLAAFIEAAQIYLGDHSLDSDDEEEARATPQNEGVEHPRHPRR